jgi:DNA end-binding protein Ku
MFQLTEEDLDSLEVEANRNIQLEEFVPLASVDPIYFESSYYLRQRRREALPLTC